MNAERRKSLKEAIAQLDDARSTIESVRDEEQETFDNMPENMQSGERGEKMEEAISVLEEAASSIEQIVSDIEGAME